MKKYIVLLVMLLTANSAFSQAKRPTIMVVPSIAWCNQNGYIITVDNQGTIQKIPDYERAFQENPDLILVISKINGMMAERGFPIVDLQSTISSSQSQDALDNLWVSKSGNGMVETAYDKALTAKADIRIEILWTINQMGPKRSVTFVMKGMDSYSNKEVASALGTGAQSFSVELPILLEEAILNYMDNFNAGLQRHFDDLFANGREIKVTIRKTPVWDEDLETEYNGMELGEIIEEWMAANTVKGRFSTLTATENKMEFIQVRIPLYDEKGKAVDARAYMRKLSNYLKNPPFSIVNKVMARGLGEVYIILGEK